jgi:hypothetical protein
MTTPNQIRFINPFSYRLEKPHHDRVNTAKPVLDYRGVKVYRRFSEAYVYLVGDVLVSERTGYKLGKELIDKMLDGHEEYWHKERFDEALALGQSLLATA